MRFLISLVLYLLLKKPSATILSTKWCNSENYPGSNLNLVQSNLDRLKAILSAGPFDLKSRISHYGPSRPGRKKLHIISTTVCDSKLKP